MLSSPRCRVGGTAGGAGAGAALRRLAHPPLPPRAPADEGAATLRDRLRAERDLLHVRLHPRRRADVAGAGKPSAAPATSCRAVFRRDRRGSPGRIGVGVSTSPSWHGAAAHSGTEPGETKSSRPGVGSRCGPRWISPAWSGPTFLERRCRAGPSSGLPPALPTSSAGSGTRARAAPVPSGPTSPATNPPARFRVYLQFAMSGQPTSHPQDHSPL